MQQYMLHCLQEKHRLIIQLLLLIVPFCPVKMQHEFTDPVTDCAFLPRLFFFRRDQIFIVRQRAFFF